jgi:DNA-binding PadR family transcriptional regulator
MAFKKDLSTLVLGILQEEGLHGYEIAKRIREKGMNSLDVAEGRLYPALHKLEIDGLIEAQWIPQEGRPPRKVYSLTEGGQEELSKQRQAWKEFAESVDSILSPSRPAGQSAFAGLRRIVERTA